MKNVGKIDKIIRLVLGIVLFSLFFLLEGNLKFLGLLGFIPIITGLINFCPLYRVFGIHTNKK